MLGQLDADGGTVVIADMEAGTGTLTRMPEASLDLVLLVTEPSLKSIEVSRRAAAIVRERGIGPCLVVANRVRDAGDRELIGTGTSAAEMQVIPEDESVARAERDGLAVVDVAPAAPAVLAAGELASSLAGRLRAKTRIE